MSNNKYINKLIDLIKEDQFKNVSWTNRDLLYSPSSTASIPDDIYNIYYINILQTDESYIVYINKNISGGNPAYYYRLFKNRKSNLEMYDAVTDILNHVIPDTEIPLVNYFNRYASKKEFNYIVTETGSLKYEFRYPNKYNNKSIRLCLIYSDKSLSENYVIFETEIINEYSGKNKVLNELEKYINYNIEESSYANILVSGDFSNNVYDVLQKDYRRRFDKTSKDMISIRLEREVRRGV